MVDIINNTSKLLGDDLKSELKSGSRLRIAASCFSIYAYAALKEELEKIDELNFLFTTPTFLSEQVSDNIKKEKREFFIPKFSETGICGTEFEIKLKNQMTQKAIARECAEWIKEKVKIKTLKAPISTQTMINVQTGDTHVHYTPVEGFTTADLGYERNDSIAEFLFSKNVITEFEKKELVMANSLLDSFNSVRNTQTGAHPNPIISNDDAEFVVKIISANMLLLEKKVKNYLQQVN